MFSKKKDDEELKKAREKVQTLTDSLKQKTLAAGQDVNARGLDEKADSIESSLRNNAFEKPTSEMNDDYSKLQTLLEDYKATLSKKAIPTPDVLQDEIKEDKLLDDKIVYVDELLAAVREKDFRTLSEKWTTHTEAIAAHRDVGAGNSFFGLSAFVKPLYNQVMGSAGSSLVAAMQPIYQDLETRAKAQQSYKPY